MSFMNTLKDKLGMAKGKASDAARQHGGKVGSGIDKAAKAADSKTGGKYSEKIGSAAEKAKGAMGKLSSGKSGQGTSGQGTSGQS